MAVRATMLARFQQFRHILIFERRGWTDRLVFALAIGLPLTAGVTARLLLNYNAADLTLEGALLVGLIACPRSTSAVLDSGRTGTRASFRAAPPQIPVNLRIYGIFCHSRAPSGLQPTVHEGG